MIQWVNVMYPEGVSTCADVVGSDASGAAELGAWSQLDLKAPLMLTGKNYGPNLYGYVNTGVAPVDGGCCADTMRIWNQVRESAITSLYRRMRPHCATI